MPSKKLTIEEMVEYAPKWSENKTVNPATGKTIQVGKETYNKYVLAYELYLKKEEEKKSKPAIKQESNPENKPEIIHESKPKIKQSIKQESRQDIIPESKPEIRIDRALLSNEKRALQSIRPRIEKAVSRVRTRMNISNCVPPADVGIMSKITTFATSISFKKLDYTSLVNAKSVNDLRWLNVAIPLREHYYNDFVPFLRENGITYSMNTFDKEWLNEQVAYIQSLSVEELKIIGIYCGTAKFYGIVNRFLRDPYATITVEERRVIRYGVMEYIRNRLTQLKPGDFYNDLKVQDILPGLEDYVPRRKMEKEKVEVYITKVIELVQNIHMISPYKQNAFIVWVASDLLNDVFYAKVLLEYTKTVQRIIKSAPVTRKEFMVYRGVKSTYHQKDLKPFYKPGGPYVFTHKGFESTTLDYRVSNLSEFTSAPIGRPGPTSAYMIRVLPNTQCLILFPVSKYSAECEILFPHGSQFFVEHGEVTKYSPRYITYPETCIRDFNVQRVTQMTSIPHHKARSISYKFSSSSAASSSTPVANP